ncbi:PAS domain S-box protein [Flavobacterium muglaense]|uniref:histidine kinase n=1 Tax=Flavobacterium muglaense TaxID=2764716 RepID=A0A923MZN0_9FLAO|nr:PAS domain S-box protein [Flavobacterium muglaense]MBC5838137.1 PAS domain S-box protein [Flavobacterium muglaense]MBC5844671.1 PAS domain S-box protein [Flavobacterium muglaense]
MKSKINWSSFITFFLNKPKITGFIVFVCLFAIFSYLVAQQYKIQKENNHIMMNRTLKEIDQNIEQKLKNCYTTTLTLALTINDEGIPEDFNAIGKRLLESNDVVSAVQLVPNGVIKYTYPLKGNEAATGLDILKSKKLKREALKSVLNKKMYFAGPFKLKQGGLGIVGRFPVYNKNHFWGFSAVIIKLEQLLKVSGVHNIDTTNFSFQMSKKNPETFKEEFYLPQKVKFTENNFVTSTVPDGDWKIYLIDLKANKATSTLFISQLLGFILALTFGFLVVLFLKKPAELQHLVEQQAAILIDSEIKFKTIFDQAAIGIANVDTSTGTFIEINNQFCKMLGYSQQEMKTKTFLQITHPDDLKKDLNNVNKLKTGVINEYSMEKRYFTKEGATVWVNLNVAPLLNQKNEQISVLAIVEDITLKKQTEKIIRERENHFKSLFEDSPLPLREENFSKVKLYLQELNLIEKPAEEVSSYLTKNPNITHQLHALIEVINANHACLDLYNVNSKDELIAAKKELFNPNSFSDFVKQLVIITQNQDNFSIDTIIKNAQQEYRNINLRWNVIRGYEKSLDRIIVSNEDITNRKRAEKIILNSQEKIESLMNTIDGIVWECRPDDFAFTFVSKKVEGILGYTAEEWLESPTFWTDHIYPEDKEATLEFCKIKTTNKEDHDFEYRMVAKDGRTVWLRDIVSIVSENNKITSLRGIMIDITKSKEVENDLKKSFDLVSEQNKRLLNFSYIVSHNLRSHTSNITSLTELIDTAESDEEREQMIGLLKTVANSLNETMTNLNEVVNIQTNIGLVVEKINLKTYIDNTLKLVSEQIKNKEASIQSNVNEEIEINYNPAYLESILYNIISNALRYSDKTRKPLISIEFTKENNQNIIAITDNGIGIDLDKNGSKIFGMYKTFSENPDSKGIGLFITKNQIEAMGGTITIESKPGAGTTFKIYIA